MLLASIIAASCLTGMALLHAVASKFFSVVIVNGKRPINPAFQPPTAVLMSVRGCDPSLERCLRGLLDQTHTNYRVHVVVDNVNDQAWSSVQHVKSEFDTHGILNILELSDPSNSCSLKCSALVQAIDQLPPETELVVLVDADVIPHQEWLMQATSPLCDPKVGVVTGNQWFEPPANDSGSLLRSLWNAGALVPTSVLANPWAGSCAMRLDDMRQSGLIETWRKSIVDDGPIRHAFRPIGKHIVFNPELIMVNREACTIEYVNRYVPRMLMWSRLHEKTFINTFLYMIAQITWLGLTLILGIVSLVLGLGLSAAICGVALAANIGLNLFSYLVVRGSIQRIEGRRDEANHQHYLEPVRLLRIAKLALLIPLCQLGFGYWMFRSVFKRTVNWRQITYEVTSHDRIRMVRYSPMIAQLEPTGSEVSI
ncbi:MAG: glycosyltransferase family 2 protein [Planctomycetales bacterium]|nr:glycosyltransferase family 2 protein [Planctomycetales bacterium]